MGTQSRGTWSWFFWAIMVVHCVAILIFTRGFLLTRTELPYYSNCSDIRSSPCLFDSDTYRNNTNNNNQSRNNQFCWTKPAVNRLVIIVLDALRFDFVAPSSFFEEPKPWMNKLLVLQKLASERNSSARIFKAIADPPTTSLQRLKGLTTGGLPTFIDVGNSFGAPAILEDNLIHQLVLNGKKVVMMGDDTWIQLFPHHFAKSYPFPSFNVKDLHTVDNGCIDHLLPALYEEDWDVLIAHFLGVDHAGHIFGVDSIPMIEKLEQYNTILERVIGVLESQSRPGGLHENTFLLVMGDHGQTLNGDHGGGGAEEVETSIFAMSFKKPPAPTPSEFGSSFCQLDLEQKNMCISSVQQLDFAVTVSALLGVSFPFGSIGLVNPELYALAGGTWELKGPTGNCEKQSKLGEWMHNYVNVLCINSWQVKRYIDIYSASSVIGFSSEDLLQVSNLYAQAEEDWSSTKRLLLLEHENCNASSSTFKRQIDAYFSFLSSVAELARSKWTEFNLGMMAVGFGIMLISLFMHFFAIKMVSKSGGIYLPSSVDSSFPTLFVVTLFIVMIRALSFLSNSYILEEGKVANFLLATIGIFRLQYSIRENKRLIEAVAFLLLISILRFAIEVGLSKQAATSAFMNANPSWTIGFVIGHHLSTCIAEIVPILSLIVLACMQYKTVADIVCCGVYKYVIVGTIFSYMLIAVHWALESNLVDFVLLPQGIRRNFIPRIIYAIGFGQLLLLALSQVLETEKALNCARSLFIKTVSLLSACSSTVIILSGTQGPLIALACIIGGHCIARLQSVECNMKDETPGISTYDPLSVTQWSLLAVCLFFSSGHWCAFDGLRYGAAFIGFDEFVLARQAILLTIDTFGFSHILPVFGLPYLVYCQELTFRRTDQGKFLIIMKLTQMYMIYGLITATALTATVLCVTLQRRHLMVWGLFAPKFVFDVVGLILTDILICLASTYYFSQVKNHDAPRDQITEK